MSSSSSSPIKDYNSAVAALYSPLHQSTTPETINAASARRTNTIHDMNTYLHRIGLDLNNNNNNGLSSTRQQQQQQHYTPPLIIHITGTKGKGSTLSYCESLLRNVYKLHTGMFTSPHLVSITERIRINGKPISCEIFGDVYWTVRDLLEKNCHQHIMLPNNSNDKAEGELSPLPILPGYFRMLTLMAIYTFCYIEQPKVDVILLEVGMGGRYDATNIFESNNNRVLVQGITLIDYDHTRILGSTLEQIAWEKGGIFVTNKICNVGRNDGGYAKFLECYQQELQQQQRQGREDANVNSSNSNSNSSSSTNDNNILFVNGNNTPQVSNVLRTIAHKENGQLQLITNNNNNTTDSSTLFFSSLSKLLQFHAKYQYDNAALALAICQYAMRQYCIHNKSKRMICRTHETVVKQQLDTEDGTCNEDLVARALNNTFWPGRCHTLIVPPASSSATGGTSASVGKEEVVVSTMKLRCDGAHTPISINACIRWFQSIIKSYDKTEEEEDAAKEVLKVLIFNCGHERNPIPLLYSLNRSGLFDCVYFCRADFERPSALPKKLLDEWLNEPLLLNGQQRSDKDGDVALTYQAMYNQVAKVVQRDDDDDDMNKKIITWQETLANIWRIMDLYHHSQLAAERKKSSLPTSAEEDNNIDDDKRRKVLVGLKVADAIRQIQNEQQLAAQADNDNGDEQASVVETLVTGSLYLVGSALEAVGWEEKESEGVLLHSYD